MMDSRSKRTFKFIFLTLIVDLLAFTLILPLLPKILDYYATNDNSNTYGIYTEYVKILQELLRIPNSHSQVLLAGILGSWFSLLQFISSPFFGALSDKFGRKMILIMTMSGSVLSYAIWFMSAQNFGLFVLSRTIGGLSKANVGLSLAIVSDVSNEANRGKGMAVVGSSFSLAFIFGPLLGAYLSTLAPTSQSTSQLIRNPALIALLLSIVNIILVVMFLEETNDKMNEEKNAVNMRRRTNSSNSNNNNNNLINGTNLTRAFHYVNPKSLFNFKLVKQLPPTQATILKSTGSIYFYYLLFYSGLEFTLSFLTHIRFGFSSMDQGKLYLFSGILMALIQGGYIRRIKGGREPSIALIGLVLIIPSFIFMGLASSISHIYYSLIMYAISSAIVVPCLTTIISSQCPIESRGVVMGTFRSIGALARAMGPILASLLFFTFGATICYISGAIALLLPLILMRGLHIRLKQLNQPGTIATKITTDKHSLVIANHNHPAKAS